jgi:hypothetical protein
VSIIAEQLPSTQPLHAPSVARPRGLVVNSRLEQVPELPVQDRAEEEDDVGDAQKSDDDSPPVTRATRRVKPQDEAKPTQLRFYSGHWVGVLAKAKNRYRMSLYNTVHPFPPKDEATLMVANDFILEACHALSDDEYEELDKSMSSFTLVHCLLTTR